MSKAILYDATLCVGCLECEVACSRQNKLPWDDALAEQKFTSSRKFTVVQENPDGDFMRRLCMHCMDPSCVSVCPVAALQKTSLGPVIYDEDRCMGCRYCMIACPFGVPKYEWDELLPGVAKCTMCYERTSIGLPTACTAACLFDATITGERDELIEEAHLRIRENPEQYVNHVFGEKEVGGTSVLFLSAVPFEEFGFSPDYPLDPLSLRTWKALSHVPDVTMLGFVLLGGIWWITDRRHEVALHERDENRKSRKPEGSEKEKGGES